MIQDVKNALAGAPWYVNSITIRGLAVAMAGFIGHLVGHKLSHDLVEALCDGLTFLGILYAGHGRIQKEKDSDKAVVVAAVTGVIPSDVTQRALGK